MKYLMLKTYLILLIYVSTNLVQRLGAICKEKSTLVTADLQKSALQLKECSGFDVMKACGELAWVGIPPWNAVNSQP